MGPPPRPVSFPAPEEARPLLGCPSRRNKSKLCKALGLSEGRVQERVSEEPGGRAERHLRPPAPGGRLQLRSVGGRRSRELGSAGRAPQVRAPPSAAGAGRVPGPEISMLTAWLPFTVTAPLGTPSRNALPLHAGIRVTSRDSGSESLPVLSLMCS